MFIKYSTSQIRPKKSRVKKKTSSKRRVKKKVTLSVDDNIIFDDPDVDLELAKSISKTEAKEAKEARQSKPATLKTKLKGAPSLTSEEQEATDIMQALKERVLDKSTVVSTTSSEGTGIKPGVPYEEKDINEEKKDDKDGDADDEGDDHISDTQDADDEDVKTKSDEDGIYKYKIHVRKDHDEEMISAEVDDSDKGDEEITDAAKADAEKTLKVKDDPKKTKLPPSSSSLSVS
ncbi:hypothetical protein Tco_1273084 [Tanacetum coccineum]